MKEDSRARLVLASASPRRRDLVGRLGLSYEIHPQDIDEEQFAVDDPAISAFTIAVAKARAAANVLKDDQIVLAADTVVVHDGAALGKPANDPSATEMLTSLRGRDHVVATGVALRTADGREWGALVQTRVEMRDYGDDEVARYVERKEPFDKAGGYAIQDAEFSPVERIDGCYLAVVGLPLCAVARGLETLGAPAPCTPNGPYVPPCSFCTGAE